MRARLLDLLAGLPYRAVACSGGVDSLTLAAAAHRAAPDTTLVVHSVTPAVPAAATARVLGTAAAEGWDLRPRPSLHEVRPVPLHQVKPRCRDELP